MEPFEDVGEKESSRVCYIAPSLLRNDKMKQKRSRNLRGKNMYQFKRIGRERSLVLGNRKKKKNKTSAFFFVNFVTNDEQ